MEDNNSKSGRNSLGRGHYEFETQNGEKVEIKLVNYMNSMHWTSYGDGPKTYEPRRQWAASQTRQLDCYDVTITKDGNSITKRCYLHLTFPRLELSNAMKDEEFAEMIESTFSPERLEEREQEAKEHDSTSLYLGGIGRHGSDYVYIGDNDEANTGKLYRYRVFDDEPKRLDSVYQSMRDDERMEAEYVASYADPEAVKQLGQHFTEEEISKALQRLDEMKETDLVHEIEATREKLEKLEAELAEHRQKMSQAKANPEIKPTDTFEIADDISEATRQIHDDMTAAKDEPTIGE